MPESRLLHRSPSTDRAFSGTLLLAPGLQQSILGELHRDGLNHLAYTAYGVQSGPLAAKSNLGFNGQVKERTGWYHLGNGHRVYNPVLMHFHSPDRLSPFGKGGLNAYAYCGGDPVNFTDPTGEFSVAISLTIQRTLTALLHVGIPAVQLMAPKATGLGLQGTRVSLLGSIGSIAGAGMQLAGVVSGTYVSNVGIALSVGGLFTRLAASGIALGSGILDRISGNIRNILGLPEPISANIANNAAANPPIPLGPVSHEIPQPSVSIIPVEAPSVVLGKDIRRS